MTLSDIGNMGKLIFGLLKYLACGKNITFDSLSKDVVIPSFLNLHLTSFNSFPNPFIQPTFVIVYRNRFDFPKEI